MSLNQPATRQAICPLPPSEASLKRLGKTRLRWVEAAPLTEEARRVLLEISAKAARKDASFNAFIPDLAKRVGLSQLETRNCLSYLHDVCLITMDGPSCGWVRFGVKAAPRVRQRPSGGDWKKLRTAVMRRDGRFCRYCWRPCLDIQIDHIHPISRGGSNDIRNLCVSCPTCNGSKGAKTWFEWRFPLGGDAA